MNYKLLFWLVWFLASTLYAQTGTYVRKSLTSTHTSWVVSNPYRIDQQRVATIVRKQLADLRFDYNRLPASVLQQFDAEVSQLTTFTEDGIHQVFQSVLLPEITAILNDPEVQKARASALNKGKRRITFAQTKGKVKSLTADELAVLMNSAFIYFPYLSSITKQTKYYPPKRQKKVRNGQTYYVETGGYVDVRMRVSGGLFIYQVVNDGFGKTAIERLVQLKGSGSEKFSLKMGPLDYRKWVKRGKPIPLADQQQAIYAAVSRLASGFLLDMKKMEAFQLKARVLEGNGFLYTLALNQSDGAYLDDVYVLMDLEEKEGKQIHVRKGLLMIHKVGKGKTNTSRARQLMGRSQGPGGWVVEDPRRGIQLGFNFQHVFGMNIGRDDLVLFLPDGLGGTKSVPLFKSALNSMSGVTFFARKNLARKTGISQFYAGLEGSVNVFGSSVNGDSDAMPYFLSLYATLHKKIGWHRSNLSLNTGFGGDWLEISGISSSEFNRYQISTLGFKYGLDYEYLFSAKRRLVVGIYHRLGFRPYSVKYEASDGSEYTFSGTDARDMYKNVRFSGVGITVGLAWDL